MAKKIPASDVSYEVMKFLVELNSPKHAAREKALKSFLKKMKIQGDEIYDDDVDIALVGKEGIHGLLVWWVIVLSFKIIPSLDTTALLLLSNLYFMVNDNNCYNLTGRERKVKIMEQHLNGLLVPRCALYIVSSQSRWEGGFKIR